MHLRLAHEPKAANCPLFAADTARAARDISGAELDYSVASLAAVDGILGGFHDEGLRTDQLGETLFGFGCYVGEVFVRTTGATWVDADSEQMRALGFSPLVQLAWGTVTNPIGKVFKRVENGPEDGLVHYYRAFSVRR